MYVRVELIDANNMADIEEELLLQANLFLLLVLKRRQRQPQNRRKGRQVNHGKRKLTLSTIYCI